MDDFDRILLRVSFVVSLVCLGIVSYWMVSAYQADPSTCDLFAGQVKGKLDVSWFPPGKLCTYGDDAFIDSPSYLRVVVLLGAVGGLPFTWWLQRSLRH